MIKAFLSHSSKDKANYVQNVARWLGKDNIVYDEFTFEEGERPLDEILKGLRRTELFVLFISESALESKWVQKEISEAKIKLDTSEIKKIFPIIIDNDITYEDSRIPQWLRDNYNLKPIMRAQVAAKRIHSKLRELAWSKHPELQRKRSIFVGRNDKLEEFEERIHDFDREKPLAIVASGVSGVGRRTFLQKALIKTNIIEAFNQPSVIVLDRNVSIEDFILKLNDLGFIDLEDDLLSLTSKTVDDKIQIIHRIMNAAYESKELVFVVDEGCIVNYKREISDWFFKTINTYNNVNFPIFCIASKYKVVYSSRSSESVFQFIELSELNSSERRRLLNQLLELYKVDLSRDNFEYVSNLLFGLPDQVMYAVDLIKNDNLTPLTDKLPILREYNSDRAAVILQKYGDDDNVLEFIRLLAQFEVISTDFIFSIVPEEEYFPLLEQLASECILELIGVEGEIVRLIDIVRDYIKRNRLQLKEEHRKAIDRQVQVLAASDDIFERDSSEYIFTLKEGLKQGIQINENLLIPSHYLRCMKDLYYSKSNLNKIVELADLILMKKNSLDSIVVQDIQYYLCLTLARQKNNRFLKEVMQIKGEEHDFLLGFFYRLQGRYQDAITRLENVIDARYVGARAKRELVQIYVQMEEYDKALDFAKRNYEENLGNQFHTQAYFNCIINSEEPYKQKEQLSILIQNLRRIDSDQSNEMADIADALFQAKVLNNEQIAFDRINDCICKYPDNHYPLLALCDIALKYNNKEQLDIGINQLDSMRKSFRVVSSRTINRYKAFQIASEGKLEEALSIIEKDLSRYPSESRERIITRLKTYSTMHEGA